MSSGHFLDAVAPLLTDRPDPVVVRTLRDAWPAERLIPLLATEDAETQRLVVVCLGIVGQMTHCRYVAAMLRSPDNAVGEAAENSLWQIWMRAGTSWATQLLRRALAHVEVDAFAAADELLATITLSEPTFAEPHHQRGLVQTLLQESAVALPCYQQALRLNPYHFAAAEGIGQIYLERGALPRAHEYYAHALHINPRLTLAREIVTGLQEALRREHDAG